VFADVISDGNVFCYTRREPVGVVGSITPVSTSILAYLLTNHSLTVCTIVICNSISYDKTSICFRTFLVDTHASTKISV